MSGISHLFFSEDTQWLDFLKTVSSKPGLEAEWVELLSLLEYVGCRKILKAVPYPQVSLETLRHISEEAIHAYLLRSASERLWGQPRTWGQGKLAQAGWLYFQNLDQEISSLPYPNDSNYPTVSWAIERRVLAVYPQYLEITQDPGVRSALKQILAQEKRHSALFFDAPLPEELKQKAAQIEERLWQGFKTAVRSSLA